MRSPSVLGALMAASRKAAPPNLSSVDDRGAGWRLLHDFGGTGTWQQDIEVKRDSVLANTTVWACTTLIASDISKVNLCLVEKTKDGIWEETESPAFSPVLRKPNAFQTRQQFIETWMLSKLSWGNTYVLKERDSRGVVVALYVLDPCRVQVLVATTGEVYYQLLEDDLSRVREDVPAIPASEIIHDRWNCLFHPLVGLSPMFAYGIVAMQGNSIQKNSTKFFTNMSRPSGLLIAPGPISKASADALKEKWETNYAGDKVGKIAVLGDGMKFESLGITAVDAQMVEQGKYSATTICSTFHVPPFKVGIEAIPAGQKVEDMNAIYFADCLDSPMDAIQTLLGLGLGLDTPKDGVRYAVRFDLDDLLRMDSATMMNTIKLGVDGSVLAPNEGRRRLNYPPVKGGESPLSQQQYYSLEALANRPAAPAPPASTPPPAASGDDADGPMSDDEMDQAMEDAA